MFVQYFYWHPLFLKDILWALSLSKSPLHNISTFDDMLHLASSKQTLAVVSGNGTQMSNQVCRLRGLIFISLCAH